MILNNKKLSIIENIYKNLSRVAISITLIGYVFLFVTCSKSTIDSSSSSCSLSPAFVLGKWQIEKAELKENGGYRDLTSSIEPCQKDDYFIFNSNGTITRVDAGNACSRPKVENGTWSFSNGKFYGNGREELVTLINCNKIIREFTSDQAQQLRYTMNRLP